MGTVKSRGDEIYKVYILQISKLSLIAMEHLHFWYKEFTLLYVVFRCNIHYMSDLACVSTQKYSHLFYNVLTS